MKRDLGITILYGSETGNAQDYAEFLAHRLKFYGLGSTISSLNDYPLKKLVTSTSYLMIVCSTTGQGDLPRNGKKFMKFILKKKLPPDLFNHIKLTTFGVGDSSYPKFNYAIRKIHARLMQLGCQELCQRCEADEQSPEGTDGYYSEWESAILTSLRNLNPAISFVYNDTVIPEPECKVEVLGGEADVETLSQNSQVSLSRSGSDDFGLKTGTIKSLDRITSTDHFQDVRHVIIDSRDLEYVPGDTVALFPSNDEKSVELLIRLQPRWIEVADKPLNLVGKVPKVEGGFIDTKLLTLRSLLTHHLDLMTIPRRSFFLHLYHFSDDSTADGAREKEKLKEFSTIEESEELFNYANRPRRLILETVLEFQHSLNIPAEYVLDVFPTIKPRLFLIASRPQQDRVELVVGIVEYKTILRRIRRGLCTKWLKLLSPGEQIRFAIHKSNLHFTTAQIEHPPIIMISPGTGVAPMKSLIESITCSTLLQQHQQQQNQQQQQLYLFYGCRFQHKDYLFADLWHQLSHQGKLHVFPCFSRSPPSKIKYVQHKLFEEIYLIANLILNQNAIVFVCGSSGSMPRQVRMTLTEILAKVGQMDSQHADKYLLDMENENRYLQETW